MIGLTEWIVEEATPNRFIDGSTLHEALTKLTMKMRNPLGALGACLLFLGLTASADASLLSRLGGQAVYDTGRDITWIADTNLAATNLFGLSIVTSGGRMSWSDANAWIAAMNAANYLGFNDWRLPTTPDSDGTCTSDAGGNTPAPGPGGYLCTGNEMGHLVYDEFGSTPGTDLIGTANPFELAMFTNLSVGVGHSSWSTPWVPLPSTFAWAFEFINGSVSTSAQVDERYVVVVRSSDVGGAESVPLGSFPAWATLTLVLLGSGWAKSLAPRES